VDAFEKASGVELKPHPARSDDGHVRNTVHAARDGSAAQAEERQRDARATGGDSRNFTPDRP
jgi:hypothetical protein